MGEKLIKASDMPKMLVALFVQQSLFLAAGIGVWILAGRPAGDFVRFSWSEVLLGVLFAGALIGLHQLICLLWPAGNLRLSREMGRSLFSTERPFGLNSILLLSWSAGIGEEAFFRGGIQTFAGLFMPGWAAILLATALFTALHPGSRAFMTCVAIVGLIFGVVYELSGSLLAVMIAHALYDVFACWWTQRELKRMGHWQDDAAPAAPQAGEAAV